MAQSEIQTILVAGYPKSGNTLLGSTFSIAGNICDPNYSAQTLYDIYTIRRIKEYAPLPNPFFSKNQLHIKTHDSLRRQNLDNKYFGNTNKVIIITRNPFDTFLSSLNFLRVLVREAGEVNHVVLDTLQKLAPKSQFPEDSTNFIAKFTLENLRRESILDDMFVQYANIGTAFSAFMSMSSPWALFSSSYDRCSKPMCRIKFEDMSAGYEDNYEKVSTKISNFLGCDSLILAKAFCLQRDSAIEKKKKGNIFFSKVASEYYSQYLSKKSLRHFCSLYYSTMVELNYNYLLESLF